MIGRNFLQEFNIKLDFDSMLSLEKLENKIYERFPNVFTDKLGECKYLKVTIPLKPDSKPVFQKPRPMEWCNIIANLFQI